MGVAEIDMKAATAVNAKKRVPLWRRVGSPRFAQVLMLIWLVLIVALFVPMQFHDMGEPIRHLAYAPLVILGVYVPLAAATAACMAQRFGVLRRRLSVKGRPRTVRPGEGAPVDGAYNRERAVRALRRAGYRWIDADDVAALGVRRPLGPLGNLALHAGLVLLVIGGAVAAMPNGQFVGRAFLVEGDVFRGGPAEYYELGHGARSPLAALPALQLGGASADVALDRPATRMDAVLRQGGSAIRLDAVTPWLASPTTLVALEDVDAAAMVSVLPSAGVTPPVRATARDGLRAESNPATVELAVPREGLYRVTLRVPKEEPAITPRALLVSVARQEGDAFRLIAKERLVPIGGLVAIGGTRVRLDDIRPAAILRVTQSPSMPMLALGVLLVGLGPVLRLCAPRREAIVRAVSDGTTIVHTRVDVHRSSDSATTRLAAAWKATS